MRLAATIRFDGKRRLTALLRSASSRGTRRGFRHLAEVQHNNPLRRARRAIDLPQFFAVTRGAAHEAGSNVAAAPETGTDHSHEHCAMAPAQPQPTATTR